MKTFFSGIISLLLASVPGLTFSQVSFERTYGGFQGELGNGVVQTSDHGYAILSTYMGDGSVIMGVASIIKTDSLGNLEWQKSITDSIFTHWTWGQNIALTRDSGFVTTGFCMQHFGGFGQHIIVTKANQNGDLMWFKVYDSLYTGYYGSYGYDIIETKDDAYILTGIVIDSTTFMNKTIVMKIDSVGNTLWQLSDTGLHRATGFSIAEDEDGNYLAFGYTTDSLSSESLMYLIKIDSTGNIIWSKNYTWTGGNGYTSGNDVISEHNGHYFLFGTGMDAGTTTGEMLLIQTDTAGNVQWSNSYPNNLAEGYAFDLTNDNGFIMSGRTYNGNTDIFLVKADSSGTEQWSTTFGGGGQDFPHSIKQTTDGGFVICGSTASYGAGNLDAYLIKTTDTGAVAVEVPRINDATFSISIFPNPTSEKLFLNSSINIVSLKILDFIGKELFTVTVFQNKVEMDIRFLSSGIYFLQVQTEKGNVVKRFIKE